MLWEIFTLGGNPYPTVPHERLFEALREGHRMDMPKYSSVDMYAIMRQCWQYHSAQRPSFAEIEDDLIEVLGNTTDVSTRGYISRNTVYHLSFIFLKFCVTFTFTMVHLVVTF